MDLLLSNWLHYKVFLMLRQRFISSGLLYYVCVHLYLLGRESN